MKKGMYHCWWHVLYFPGAGILAGVAFPLRRYGLTITNEPVFFAATVAVVSTGVLAALRFDIASQSKYRLALKSFDAFFGIAGFFEGLGALLSLMPVGVATVVVVSPIVATTSLWNLLIAYLFLEHREKLNVRTALVRLRIVGGTIVSHSADKVLNDLDTIRIHYEVFQSANSRRIRCGI